MLREIDNILLQLSVRVRVLILRRVVSVLRGILRFSVKFGVLVHHVTLLLHPLVVLLFPDRLLLESFGSGLVQIAYADRNSC